MPGCFKVILVAVPKIIGYGKCAQKNLDMCGEREIQPHLPSASSPKGVRTQAILISAKPAVKVPPLGGI